MTYHNGASTLSRRSKLIMKARLNRLLDTDRGTSWTQAQVAMERKLEEGTKRTRDRGMNTLRKPNTQHKLYRATSTQQVLCKGLKRKSGGMNSERVDREKIGKIQDFWIWIRIPRLRNPKNGFSTRAGIWSHGSGTMTKIMI